MEGTRLLSEDEGHIGLDINKTCRDLLLNRPKKVNSREQMIQEGERFSETAGNDKTSLPKSSTDFLDKDNDSRRYNSTI